MKPFTSLAALLSSFINRYFLWLLLGCYAAAALTPELGLWIRNVDLGEINFFQQRTPITVPMLMLALLLLSAGLEVPFQRLKTVSRTWLILLAGIAANLLVPIVFTFVAIPPMSLWLDPDTVQSVLLGLAVIAAMPIAGTSTAWSQKNNGNLALSLGLVVMSTLLTPVTTPLVLHAMGLLATGSYAENLRSLIAHGTELFLVVCVVVPSALGILLSWIIGQQRLAPIKPRLKLLNSVNLLMLIYVNASISLPDAIAYPDLDFLLTTVGMAVVLCILAFGTGWVVARLLNTDPAKQASLMFGLGMNNNGAGLVLASVALADYPRVLLPIIAYNLVQHLVAGAVTSLLARQSARQDVPARNVQASSVAYAPARGNKYADLNANAAISARKAWSGAFFKNFSFLRTFFLDRRRTM